MSGWQSNGSGYDHLSRANIWSSQLKTVLEDELMGTRYVRMLDGFPDGDTFNIPSIGQAEVSDYAEGQAVKYTAMDTGNFTFNITDYVQSGTYITNKMKQDSFYMSQLVADFVPSQARAIMSAMEESIMKTPTPAATGGQTTADSNTINGAKHRFVGGGTNETMVLEDFMKARYALKKANVPDVNLVAIVDPSVEYQLSTLPNLTNMSFNPRWEGIVESGLVNGLNFSRNIYGFDVYTSQRLYVNTASETIDGVSASAGVNNLFFSAAGDLIPMVGAIRQAPKVDSSYNKDYQRDEYVTTARWGFKLFRPENMVICVTDTDQVYA